MANPAFLTPPLHFFPLQSSVSPTMKIQPPIPPRRVPLQPHSYPNAPTPALIHQVQVALKNDHLGVALSLLQENPLLQLPELTAQELAGKLRRRGLPTQAKHLARHLPSPTSAINLLSSNRTRTTSSHPDLRLLIDTGRVHEAISLLRNSPPLSIDYPTMEALVQAAAAGAQVENAHFLLTVFYPRLQFRPSPHAFAAYIQACGRVGSLRRALRATSIPGFRALDKKSQVFVYESLIDACVRCGALHDAYAAYRTMKDVGLPVTEQIYACLLSAATSSRTPHFCLHLLNDMHASGFSPSSLSVYNALILSFSREANLRNALLVYKSMMASKCVTPNLQTYNALLACCAKASNPNKAFEILNSMKEEGNITPNAVSYNSVVVACARVADVDRAFQVAKTMRSQGIRLNVVTNNNLMEACCNAGHLERAFSIVRKMIQKDGLHPNSHTYNTLIRACGRWGHLEAALRLLTSMRTAGVSPTVITYSVAVDACARAGGGVAVDQAFELVDEMQSNNLEPNLVTFNSLIHACAKAKRSDLAFDVFGKIRSKGISPDIVTLCSLVDACGRSGEIERAFALIEELPREFFSLKPNVPAYNALIHACFKAGDLQRMEMACENMKKLRLRFNVVTFSTLISAYAGSGNIKQAVSVLGDMRKAGLTPNRMTFTSIIAGYGRIGEVDLAMDMLEEAKASCGEPDEELYTAAIVAAVGGGRKELAVKQASEMSRAGYFVPSVLNRIMRKIGDADRSGTELHNVLEAMEALDIKPQRAAVESLVAAYAREADVEAVLSVLPEMARLGYAPNLQTYKKVIQACALSGTDGNIRKARALFRKLRSAVPDGDARLRSHHWKELYEVMLRTLEKGGTKSKTDHRAGILKGMARDCGEENAKNIAKLVCPDLIWEV